MTRLLRSLRVWLEDVRRMRAEARGEGVFVSVRGVQRAVLRAEAERRVKEGEW